MPTKLKIDIVAIGDLLNGNRILQKKPAMLHPSIITASSISLGNVFINPDNMNIDVGRANATYGSISAIYRFIMPILLNIVNSGIKVECIGIIIPNRNRLKTKEESFHLSLLIANAAVLDKKIVIITEIKDTKVELKKLIPIFPDTHAVV